MARLWRLHHEDLPGEPGAEVSVGANDSHHALKVLRLRDGDEIALFDGDGREWVTRIVASSGGRLIVRLEREILDPEVDAPLEVVLFQAWLRPERMDWVVQKATEVGVAAIHPFPAERAESRGGAERKIDRWRRIAVESCKQCGRRSLPAIEPVETLPPAPVGETSILLQPGPDATPLSEICATAAPARVRVAIGPQAGFTSEELDAHAEAGWRFASLGPRILRADTAGAIAAAILLHRWADLG